jgi:DNA modification methylase
MRKSGDHFSDIDFANWKSEQYGDLITDTLWVLGPRDRTKPHVGDYWGNFVPQIPNQIIRRFTRPGGVVLDLFSGMGTTLIECRRLGRHGIGVELNGDIACRSEERIATAENPSNVETTVIRGDSGAPDIASKIKASLAPLGRDDVDALILHPPYHDIIRFGDDPRDLSAASDLPAFLACLAQVVANGVELLKPGGFAALVIGDKYGAGVCVPLGFECMLVCQQAGLTLKAINVKDIQGNERGKGKATNLWRYRALKQGFYVFKHEYIMLFRKPQPRIARRQVDSSK